MSGILAGIDVGASIANTAYNIFAGERNRKDYLNQQRFSNDYLKNQIQYRAEDLEKAGLHKSLAAGMGMGGSPSVGAPPPNMVQGESKIMANALRTQEIRNMKANADKTVAETFRTNLGSAIDLFENMRADSRLSISKDENIRAGQRHEKEQALRDIKAELDKANISAVTQRTILDKANATLAQQESAYRSRTGQKMPTRSTEAAELENVIAGIGQLMQGETKDAGSIASSIGSLLLTKGKSRGIKAPQAKIMVPASRAKINKPLGKQEKRYYEQVGQIRADFERRFPAASQSKITALVNIEKAKRKLYVPKVGK